MLNLTKNPIAGTFTHAETGKHFTYVPTTDEWALSMGLLDTIDVLDGVRFAKVLKTVAYVAVDEAEDGSVVFEKWPLRSHTTWAEVAAANR